MVTTKLHCGKKLTIKVAVVQAIHNYEKSTMDIQIKIMNREKNLFQLVALLSDNTLLRCDRHEVLLDPLSSEKITITVPIVDSQTSATVRIKANVGFFTIDPQNRPSSTELWNLYGKKEIRRAFFDIQTPTDALNVGPSNNVVQFNPIVEMEKKPAIQVETSTEQQKKDEVVDLREAVSTIRRSLRRTAQLALLRLDDINKFSEEHEEQLVQAQSPSDLDQHVVFVVRNRWSSTELLEKLRIAEGTSLELPAISKYMGFENLPNVRQSILGLLKTEDKDAYQDLRRIGLCRDLFLVRTPPEPAYTESDSLEICLCDEIVPRWTFRGTISSQWSKDTFNVTASPHQMTFTVAKLLLEVLDLPQKLIYTNSDFADPKWKLSSLQDLKDGGHCVNYSIGTTHGTHEEKFKIQFNRLIDESPMRAVVFLTPTQFDTAYGLLVRKPFVDPGRDRTLYVERFKRDDHQWRRLNAKASKRFMSN